MWRKDFPGINKRRSHSRSRTVTKSSVAKRAKEGVKVGVVVVKVRKRGVQQESTQSPFIPLRPRRTHVVVPHGLAIHLPMTGPSTRTELPQVEESREPEMKGVGSWSNGRHAGLGDLRNERGERETE